MAVPSTTDHTLLLQPDLADEDEVVMPLLARARTPFHRVAAGVGVAALLAAAVVATTVGVPKVLSPRAVKEEGSTTKLFSHVLGIMEKVALPQTAAGPAMAPAPSQARRQQVGVAYPEAYAAAAVPAAAAPAYPAAYAAAAVPAAAAPAYPEAYAAAAVPAAAAPADPEAYAAAAAQAAAAQAYPEAYAAAAVPPAAAPAAGMPAASVPFAAPDSPVQAAPALTPAEEVAAAPAEPAAAAVQPAVVTASRPEPAAVAAVPAGGPAVEPAAEECKMAVKEDECYKSVVWAMTDGIKEHPEWYEGLTKKSLFEEFQEHLALTPEDTKCTLKPCKASPGCMIASPDSPCYAGVQWDMKEGIKKHPEWYPGLTEGSTFEEFQRHAHKTNKTLCPTEPCNEQPFTLTTLFCWMAIQKEGYELGLAQAQLEKKLGIFACDDQVTVSTEDLGWEGVKTLIISNMKVGGFTDGGTSPNAPIFVEAWSQIQADGRWQQNDWTIKADPDAVIIPGRLRHQLLPENQPENPYPPPYKADPSKGLWVTNCDKMAGWGKGWGDGWPMMYGSIEILSREALALYYAEGQNTCQGPGGVGEDAYLGLCLRALQVGELFMRQGDNVCAGGACSDHSFSSYHPYKDIGSWMDCYGQATR